MIRVADDILLLCRTHEGSGPGPGRSQIAPGPGEHGVEGQPEGIDPRLAEGQGRRTGWASRSARASRPSSVTIAEKAWTRLEEHLVLAHEKPDSSIRAVATINGWLDALGPCYPSVLRPRVYKKLAALAAKQAFDEIPSRDAMTSHGGGGLTGAGATSATRCSSGPRCWTAFTPLRPNPLPH